MQQKNFFKEEDLKDLFEQMEGQELQGEESEEMQASQKRYEEIIKKHKEQ